MLRGRAWAVWRQTGEEQAVSLALAACQGWHWAQQMILQLMSELLPFPLPALLLLKTRGKATRWRVLCEVISSDCSASAPRSLWWTGFSALVNLFCPKIDLASLNIHREWWVAISAPGKCSHYFRRGSHIHLPQLALKQFRILSSKSLKTDIPIASKRP